MWTVKLLNAAGETHYLKAPLSRFRAEFLSGWEAQQAANDANRGSWQYRLGIFYFVEEVC